MTTSGVIGLFALSSRAAERERNTGIMLSRGEGCDCCGVAGREPPELGLDGCRIYEFGRDDVPAFGRGGETTEDGVLWIGDGEVPGVVVVYCLENPLGNSIVGAWRA